MYGKTAHCACVSLAMVTLLALQHVEPGNTA